MSCRNHVVLQENAQHVTRFIALAAVNNPAKKKVRTGVVCLSESVRVITGQLSSESLFSSDSRGRKSNDSQLRCALIPVSAF